MVLIVALNPQKQKQTISRNFFSELYTHTTSRCPELFIDTPQMYIKIFKNIFRYNLRFKGK